MSLNGYADFMRKLHKDYNEIVMKGLELLSGKDYVSCYIGTLVLNKIMREYMLRDWRIANVNNTDIAMTVIESMAEEMTKEFFEKMEADKRTKKNGSK
jgi:hypothetical protein